MSALGDSNQPLKGETSSIGQIRNQILRPKPVKITSQSGLDQDYQKSLHDPSFNSSDDDRQMQFFYRYYLMKSTKTLWSKPMMEIKLTEEKKNG